MADTINRVDDYVCISGYLAAANDAHVKKEGITHILKLFEDDPEYDRRHQGIEYCVVEADDFPDYPIESHFTECLQFIQKAIRAKGQILIHCHAGISRSATIVLLHLIINAGLPLAEAWALLKTVRPIVNPNPGFWARLAAVDRRAAQFRLEGKAPPKPPLLSPETQFL